MIENNQLNKTNIYESIQIKISKNKWGEKKLFFCSGMPINNHRIKKIMLEKLPLGNSQSDNSTKKCQWMLNLMSGSLMKNRIVTDSKYLPHTLFIYGEKIEILQWKNLADNTWIKLSKLISPVIKHNNIMCHMLRCNRKHPVSLLCCSCPESNHEKTLHKLRFRNIPQMNWLIIFKC